MRTDKIEEDRYLAKDYTKAKRWMDDKIDLQATCSPMRNPTATRQTQLFSLKILTSALQTKHNVRKTKWFRDLEEEHSKKMKYNNDLCPLCGQTETHKHLFDECAETRHHKKAFMEETDKIIKKLAGDKAYRICWWFSTPHKKLKENEEGWRGFIPKMLRETIHSITRNEIITDATVRTIAQKYQQSNLNAWLQRCTALHAGNQNKNTNT